MSKRQWKRLDAVERIERGALTVGEAAEVLGLSKRQVRRLRRAVGRRGAKGVQHGNTGRAPKHRLGEAVREQILELRRKKYDGFNDQHFTEKLGDVEGVKVSRASDAAAAARRRARRAGGAPETPPAPETANRQAGLMILWDGSRHEWLGGAGRCCA
ncbi:helix-turn-helix domain-containing protein [bacterium]|nr:helix-turn-helix domain-containing protein [bacterium]